MISISRTSYTNVLKDYFEKKLLTNQNLLATEERYEKILSMIPDECTLYYFCSPDMVLINSFYCLSYAVHVLPLQLLLLNLGEDGKIIDGPLVQKKILMLCDGNSASSCCNLENIRYKIFLLGKFRISQGNKDIFSLQ